MEDKKKNKKVLFIVLGSILGFLAILVATFFILLMPASKDNEPVVFVINKGDSKTEIVDNLKDANLIRSKYATLLYIILTKNTNIQAGSYELARNMYTQDIVKALGSGDVIKEKIPSVRITFKEGVTLKNYLKLISDNTSLEYDNVIKEINSKEFLEPLIKDYWFLDDTILNKDIYYALEGYLYPNTYEFYIESTLDDVIRKILNETKAKLEPIRKDIESNSYSIHEILTMASIAEKEANNVDDRTKVSQVIYKRLNNHMNLGMDVTTYYGVGKEYKDDDGNNIYLTKKDLANKNPYNTRLDSLIGLPIGPICNPSIESINAILNPSDTNYLYFYADEATGKVYFADTYEEFLHLKEIYG